MTLDEDEQWMKETYIAWIWNRTTSVIYNSHRKRLLVKASSSGQTRFLSSTHTHIHTYTHIHTQQQQQQYKQIKIAPGGNKYM